MDAGRTGGGRQGGSEPDGPQELGGPRPLEPGAGDPARRPDRDGEPDYRFTLANERTFLAWIRTALGLIAGGVATRQLIPSFAVPGARTALALACVALALLVAGVSYPRWRQVQTAIRHGEPIPRSIVLPLVAVGVVVIAVLAGLFVIRG